MLDIKNELDIEDLPMELYVELEPRFKKKLFEEISRKALSLIKKEELLKKFNEQFFYRA